MKKMRIAKRNNFIMKNCIGSFLAVAMVMTMGVHIAGAVSPVQEEAEFTVIEVVNYSKYLSDDKAELIKDNVNAVFITSDGESIPLDCKVIVEDVYNGDIAVYKEGSRTYAVTVSATKKKNDENSTNSNGVTATAKMTMTWTDVPGVKNTIDNLSGSIDIKSGTLRNGRVMYGNTHNNPLLRPYFETGTKENFNERVSYTSTSLTGSLHACYDSWFTEWSGTSTLRVCVHPTIFDGDEA